MNVKRVYERYRFCAGKVSCVTWSNRQRARGGQWRRRRSIHGWRREGARAKPAAIGASMVTTIRMTAFMVRK